MSHTISLCFQFLEHQYIFNLLLLNTRKNQSSLSPEGFIEACFACMILKIICDKIMILNFKILFNNDFDFEKSIELSYTYYISFLTMEEFTDNVIGILMNGGIVEYDRKIH